MVARGLEGKCEWEHQGSWENPSSRSGQMGMGNSSHLWKLWACGLSPHQSLSSQSFTAWQMQVALQLRFKAMPTIKHRGSRLQVVTSRDISAPTAQMSRQNMERGFVFEGADVFPWGITASKRVGIYPETI